MIESYSPLVQTLLGTMFTWFVTAAGSAVVFFFKGYKRSFLDASLGFAAGVMTAASFWSLLLPAIEISQTLYGDENKLVALIPILVGFFLGAAFVYFADILLPEDIMQPKLKEETKLSYDLNESMLSYGKNVVEKKINLNTMRHRAANLGQRDDLNKTKSFNEFYDDTRKELIDRTRSETSRFRKIILLIVAVTIHNIPEGLAVGVGFGAIGKTSRATFLNARNLAIGIGIQNFPEGLAVSLPLYASGQSYWKSFWYGQLSGMVEPIAGLIGLISVSLAEIILPYALAFAAGAMIFVVVENIIPETAAQGNGKLASWSCMIGFAIMMLMDVGLN